MEVKMTIDVSNTNTTNVPATPRSEQVAELSKQELSVLEAKAELQEDKAVNEDQSKIDAMKDKDMDVDKQDTALLKRKRENQAGQRAASPKKGKRDMATQVTDGDTELKPKDTGNKPTLQDVIAWGAHSSYATLHTVAQVRYAAFMASEEGPTYLNKLHEEAKRQAPKQTVSGILNALDAQVSAIKQAKQVVAKPAEQDAKPPAEQDAKPPAEQDAKPVEQSKFLVLKEYYQENVQGGDVEKFTTYKELYDHILENDPCVRGDANILEEQLKQYESKENVVVVEPAEQDVKPVEPAEREENVPELCKGLMSPDEYEKKYDAQEDPLEELNGKIRLRNAKLKKLFKKQDYKDANYEERKKMREDTAGPEPDDAKVMKMMGELRTAMNAINKVCSRYRNRYPLWFGKKSLYNQCTARMKCVSSSDYRRRWDTLAKLSTEGGKQAYKQEEEKRKALIEKQNASFEERLKQRTDGLGYLARNAGGIEVIHISPPQLNL